MINRILEKIKEYDVIVLSRHIKPDGDASGSQLGLKYLIEENFKGKKVYVEGEPNTYFGRLIGNVDPNIVIPEGVKYLQIILDCANLARVDGKLYLGASDIIKIDHHLFVEDFKGIEYIDNSAIATCQMIARIAYEGKLKMNSKAATSLFLGLVTDSNRFLYSEVSSETFKLASYLLSYGVDTQRIYNYLYETDVESLRFRGYCMNNVKVEDGVAYNMFDKDILDKYHVNGNQAASMVNAISNIKGVHIHVHFAYIEENVIRVELRSKDIPVNFVAEKYGGGGHKCASGAIVNSFSRAKEMIMDLKDLVRGAFEEDE